MDKDFVKILADLKFIGSVKKGEIVYIAQRTVAPRTMFSTMYRKYWLKGESGRDTAEFVARTLANTYRLIDQFREGEGMEKYIKHLIDHVKDVRTAIEELQVTYEKYSYIDANFDAILIDIERALEVYEK